MLGKLLKFGMWDAEGGGNLYKNDSKFKRGAQSYICVKNDVLFLPVNILMVWHAGFLGRTTLPCVLILLLQ